jgi:zinc protease
MPERRLAVYAPPVTGAPPDPRVPRPERAMLENGLRVLSLPRRGVPQVVLKAVLPAGAAADPPGHPGTASLVGQLLTEGTGSLDATELNERLDGLGASIHAAVGPDYVEVEAVLLAETLAEGIELFAEVLARPAFPERETERIRAESLDALLSRADEPAVVADDRVALEVFGAHHPYGRPTPGTREGISSVPRDALAAFHAARYRPAGSFLVAAGDFDAGELVALLRERLGGWRGEAAPRWMPAPPGAPERSGGVVVVPRGEASQSEIRVGGIGLPRSSPRWFTAGVANFVLGGSTITGRLGSNLREDKGWTYGARSGFHAGLHAGAWIADTAVDVEVTADAVAEIVAEARRMATEPVSDDELHRARDALVLSLPRAFETPASVAARFVTVEAFGLPADYWERYRERVEAVTVDAVLALAREHFHPDGLVRVVVGAWPRGS